MFLQVKANKALPGTNPRGEGVISNAVRHKLVVMHHEPGYAPPSVPGRIMAGEYLPGDGRENRVRKGNGDSASEWSYLKASGFIAKRAELFISRWTYPLKRVMPIGGRGITYVWP